MLKITSGIHRGRLLASVPGNSTRPTSERLRQAWLNSLQIYLPDARILDLFSGSGALGFEALSRGATSIDFIEENPKASKVISMNATTLNCQESIRVFTRRVESCLNLIVESVQSSTPYDLIFMDPPYEKGFEEKLLAQWPWEKILNTQGRLCVESAHRKEGAFNPPETLQIVRHERYGDSQLTFYALKEGTE